MIISELIKELQRAQTEIGKEAVHVFYMDSYYDDIEVENVEVSRNKKIVILS